MMYLSLKRLGVETELVIYPGEGHNLSQLDHQIDRMKRVLAWFNKYLK
jgi:dipeptidyl aminopeptidase/acylaminoacyl peptidase